MTTKILTVLLTLGLLSGCSGLLTSNDRIDKFYTLNATTHLSEELGPFDYTIVVEKPVIAKALDSDRIMLKKSPQLMDYYANARWAGPLGNVIQLSLVESFENSDVLSRVTTDEAAVSADYALVVDVYAFQAEYADLDAPPTVHIKMVAKLLTFNGREMVASFTTEVHERAEENEFEDVMDAFDDAFQGAQAMLITELLDYFSYVYYTGQHHAYEVTP